MTLARDDAVLALGGPQAEADMRLTRLPGADLRRDGAQLMDAIKATGFFPGPRVVVVEHANDGAAPACAEALADWREGDANIVVTAGKLTKNSALKKLFEGSPIAVAAGFYDEPPTRAEIEAQLARAGLRDIDRSGMDALIALSREVGPGDLRQTIEKVALYKLGDTAPLMAEDVAALAPASDGDLDGLLHAVAEGAVAEIGPKVQRLEAQGTAPVTLVIRTMQHFRTLHAVASDPGGPAQGIGRARPPVFGPRRDRMLRQAQGWGTYRLEDALSMILEADLALRSAGQTAPAMARVERLFIRLAMLGRR